MPETRNGSSCSTGHHRPCSGGIDSRNSEPVTFFVTPHYATAPGVIVRLSRVDPDALRELLVEAWRTVAPKRLIKAYDQSAM